MVKNIQDEVEEKLVRSVEFVRLQLSIFRAASKDVCIDRANVNWCIRWGFPVNAPKSQREAFMGWKEDVSWLNPSLGLSRELMLLKHVHDATTKWT